MANNDNKDNNDNNIEVLPALTKKQKKANKILQKTKDHDYQVANLAVSASDMVAKRTNSFGGFAAFLGVHAVDFLLGTTDFSDDAKKKKKKKKKNKKKFYKNKDEFDDK